MSDPRFATTPGVYMLSHSIGLPAADVADELRRGYLDAWINDPTNAWPRWIQEIDGFRSALAALFNSSSHLFCPQSNLSSALTKLLYALPLTPGRNQILLTEHDFPTIGFVVERARERGFEPRFIDSERDVADPATWNACIDERTAFVIVTHVHSNTSQRVPVKSILQATRRADAISVVDIAQSAGIMPIDFSDWDADAVIGSCVKWLCGGPGAGFLWINESLLPRCEPIDVGWFSHANPFEFDIHRFRFADDALRFWGGTPNVAPYVAARRGVILIHEAGVNDIAAHNRQLTERLLAAVPADAVHCPTNAAQRGGTVVLHFGPDQSAVKARLNDAKVHYDERSAGIRLSPHIYNDINDVDTVAACLSA